MKKNNSIKQTAELIELKNKYGFDFLQSVFDYTMKNTFKIEKFGVDLYDKKTFNNKTKKDK